ncbi:MAG TPA: TRAP transporter small permease [Stellaceae bacterium]|nr:TRAP transporter small permease [Stellaceae bacterium]
MIETVLRGVRAVLVAARIVSAVLLCSSVALNFANIIGRYFFSVSISWAEEIMLFLMVGCVFIGNGPVAWSGRQIHMDVIVGMMPAKARQFLELVSDLLFIATAIVLTVFAWPVIVDLAAYDERSQAANFPLVIPQALIPAGLSVMALFVAIRLLTRGRHASGEARPQ